MAAKQLLKGVLIAALRARPELGIIIHRDNGRHRDSKSGRQVGPRPKRPAAGGLPKIHVPPPQESDRARSSLPPKGSRKRLPLSEAHSYLRHAAFPPAPTEPPATVYPFPSPPAAPDESLRAASC